MQLLKEPEECLDVNSPGRADGPGQLLNGLHYLSGKLSQLSAWIHDRPILPYLLIVALVLKVMWGVWDLKDLSSGDSACYYVGATEGLHRWRVNFAWSPIFTALGALFLCVSSHPLFFCIGIRLSVVLGIALLTLAIARRSLPRPLAWFVAAWWAILPINFDSLYEVHLFAALPILLSWLALSPGKSRWARGIALSTMILTTFLVRNEQAITTTLLAIAMSLYEVNARKKSEKPEPLRSVLVPYVLPVSLTLLVVSVFYVRSTLHFPELGPILAAKHTVNVGQIYAYGYQQRVPSWTQNPWTDYGPLMIQTFGAKELTMTQAFARNPEAMLCHFAWNLRLIPAGLQVLLFDATADSVDPDYAPVQFNFWRATVPTCALLLVLAIGLRKCWSKKEQSLSWLKAQGWCVAAMSASALCSLVVMLMQRPRPSYIFTLGISIMFLTGFCLWRATQRTVISRVASALAPVAMVLLLILAPCHYFIKRNSFYATYFQQTKRPLLEMYDLLRPFSAEILLSPGRILVPGFNYELDAYLYGGLSGRLQNKWVSYQQVKPWILDRQSLAAKLDRQNVTCVLLNTPVCQMPQTLEFMKTAPRNGWKLLACHDTEFEKTYLYCKKNGFEDESKTSWNPAVLHYVWGIDERGLGR